MTETAANYTDSLFINTSCDHAPAICVHELWKSYGPVSVLKGLNLSVPESKTMVILGRSGVGKSVLLKQIIGLEKPDSGFIEVENVRITDLKPKEFYKQVNRFGMLFQSSALFDSMTVAENVAFYLCQHQGMCMQDSEVSARVAESLDKVGLAGYQNKMPSELSGGQKRRAALARLIIYRPKIMLYDEPTTGLDPITSTQISELIAETNRELGATTILVTHDIQSSLIVGDLFSLHHDGKIAFSGDKKSFFTSDNPLVTAFLANTSFGKNGSPIDYQGEHQNRYTDREALPQ